MQIHGNCYPHNATAAYPIVKGLNAANIGIKIDPGNNYAQEGYEDFTYQIHLLKEYIQAVGAKDACSLRVRETEEGNKGWQTFFVPAYEGRSNYDQVYSELKMIGFKGPMILMPFYNTDNPPTMIEKLKKEISYFKSKEQRYGF